MSYVASYPARLLSCFCHLPEYALLKLGMQSFLLVLKHLARGCMAYPEQHRVVFVFSTKLPFPTNTACLPLPEHHQAIKNVGAFGADVQLGPRARAEQVRLRQRRGPLVFGVLRYSSQVSSAPARTRKVVVGLQS